MQFVAARDLREGMCVAEDVKDAYGRTLIARGQRLGLHHIVSLRRFRVESLFIDPRGGETVEKPTQSELRRQCEEVLRSSRDQLTKNFTEKRIALDTQSIQAIADKLVEALVKSKNPLVTLLDVSSSSDHLMQHSVNTSVLALALAIDLRVPEPMLNDLAVAMMFHDIGMIFLPDELSRKTTPLTAEEVETLRQHPHLAADHLLRANAVSSVAANLILSHHEHLNGSGYPQKLAGDKLSVLMRIMHVTEIYDTLTTPHFGHPAVLPDAAISYLLSNIGTLFAKEVVLALCKRVALYPPGIAVRLNSGEYGVVAGVLATAPMRPVVLLHTDNKGKRLKDPMIVDLAQEQRRAIMQSGTCLDTLIESKDRSQLPIDPVLANLG